MMMDVEKNVRVLVVDDDEDDYIIVRNMLKKARGEFESSWASSYDVALQLVENEHFDVCLVDYRLGDRNGLDFLNEDIIIKQDMPVIVLTGQGAEEIDFVAMEKGAADYLNKNELSFDSLEHSIRYSIYRKQTERSLKELNVNMNRFVGIVAHDLRNPIGTIMGYCELLEGYVRGAIELEILGDMRTLCGIALNLVNDILDLAAIKGGTIRIEKDFFEMLDVVDNAIDSNHLFAQKKNIELVVDMEKTNRVFADKKRILQVLTNLLNNAVKFTPKNGKVTVRTEHLNNFLRIEVIDTGVGINAENVSKIFDKSIPFSTSGTDGERGTGYGLPLCQELIHWHGGSIEVETHPEKGSRFYFSLPEYQTD